MSTEDFMKTIQKKNPAKRRTSFNIDEKTLNEFNKICNSKNYIKSIVINNFMKKFVEQEKSLKI